jgi:hypothetical protein
MDEQDSDIDHVRGVQGRYFTIVLPVATIFIAAVINLEVRRGLTPWLATLAAMISGVSTVEVLGQAHW